MTILATSFIIWVHVIKNLKKKKKKREIEREKKRNNTTSYKACVLSIKTTSAQILFDMLLQILLENERE